MTFTNNSFGQFQKQSIVVQLVNLSISFETGVLCILWSILDQLKMFKRLFIRSRQWSIFDEFVNREKVSLVRISKTTTDTLGISVV